MAAPIAIGAVDALVSNTNNFTVVLLFTFYTQSCSISFIQVAVKTSLIGSISILLKVLQARLLQKANDWDLFFFYDNLEYKQALSIEQHIKSMKSSLKHQ